MALTAIWRLVRSCFEDTIVFDVEMHIIPCSLLDIRDPQHGDVSRVLVARLPQRVVFHKGWKRVEPVGIV